MIDDQNRMMSQFKAAMAKLQVLGQDTSKLIDCSDVRWPIQVITSVKSFLTDF